MGAPPYMKLFVADFIADTLHLTRGQVGAYWLLIMAMWRAGGKLPAVDAKLAQITRCSPKDWATDKETLLALFQRRGGQLTHKRMTTELAKAGHVSSVRKEASDKAVSERRKKNNEEGTPIGAPNADQLAPYIRHQSQKKKPPKPPEGAFDLVDEHFEKAWSAYPDKTTTNREKAKAAFDAALPAAGGCAPLTRAVEAYAAHQAAAGAKAKPTPAFHRWLAGRRFEAFPGEASNEPQPWAGPQAVWDAVCAPPRSDAFGRSWLSPCTWQDTPIKAVVSPSPTATRKLREEVGPILNDMGIQLLERAA